MDKVGENARRAADLRDYQVAEMDARRHAELCDLCLAHHGNTWSNPRSECCSSRLLCSSGGCRLRADQWTHDLLVMPQRPRAPSITCTTVERFAELRRPAPCRAAKYDVATSGSE